MHKISESEFHQACIAQAAKVVGDSLLIVGTGVNQCPNDARELGNIVGAIPQALGPPELVLADAGYANEDEVQALKNQGKLPLVAMRGGSHQPP